YSILRDAVAVQERSKDLIEFAHRHHYLYFESIGKLQQSWALTMQESIDSVRLGVQQLQDGLEALTQTGTGLGTRSFYVLLADTYTRLGDKAEAIASVEKAMGQPGLGARSWDAEIQRVLGEALKLSPNSDLDRALACFQRAIETARQQGARAFELRAVVSCARTLMQMERVREAHDLLATHAAIAEPSTREATEINQLRIEVARRLPPEIY